MEIFKKTSTVAYLLLALIVIVIAGFWFSKDDAVITDLKGKEVYYIKKGKSESSSTSGTNTGA